MSPKINSPILNAGHTQNINLNLTCRYLLITKLKISQASLTVDYDADEGTSPICIHSTHTFIHAFNLYSQFNLVSKSAMVVVEEIHSLASVFETGLPQKAVLKLKLKREVEEGRLQSGTLSGWKMCMGKTSEGADWAKGQEADWVLPGVGCRVEGGQLWVAVMMITANYTYWQGQKSAYFVKRSTCWFIKEAGSSLDIYYSLVLVKYYVLTLKATFFGASFHMEWYG